jgi:hypothetical protein
MKYMVAELVHKAEKAWYENERVHIILSDKKQVSFPIELNDKLKVASVSQLEKIEIICKGTGLHWPDLDEDLSVLGILEGKFGN